MNVSSNITVQKDLELGVGIPFISIGMTIAARKMLIMNPVVAKISLVNPILAPLEAMKIRKSMIMRSARFISKLYYAKLIKMGEFHLCQ